MEEIRGLVIESARNFKVSWVALGQALYTVWKDKLFYDWGYENFELYVCKEAGIQKKTAVKLLRNYFFLENEEPRYIQQERLAETEPVKVPGEDAVNVVRLAKARRDLDKSDYEALKNDAFNNFKDAGLLKKDLTAYIKQREEISPEEAREKERHKLLTKYINSLKNLRKDGELLRILPENIIKDTALLIEKLEKELAPPDSTDEYGQQEPVAVSYEEGQKYDFDLQDT